MSSITINGMTFSGSNISINNNKLYIDGKFQELPDAKEINIVVDGNIGTLKVDNCNSLSVTGDADSIETMSGSVTVNGSCDGSIKTMSGNVKVLGHVAGKVSTMSGNIKHN